MTNTKLNPLFFLLGCSIFVTSLGCNSPLLNHAQAGETGKLQMREGSACPLAFGSAGLCAELAWSAPLNDQDPASFTLRFWDAVTSNSGGPYVNPPSDLKVMLWMPEMGHGSSPIHLQGLKASDGSVVPGVFSGTDVYFLMPGMWDVRVQLKNGDQVLEEVVFSVQI